jgi:hypothetical protein
MFMLDCLFINVPQISLVYPPAATSLLKGICEQHGYSARVRDLNLEMYYRCSDNNIISELDQYFSLNDHGSRLTAATEQWLSDYLDQVVSEIVDQNPRWLGISVFTFQCQIFSYRLLQRLRFSFPGQIVIGGAGLSTNGISAKENDFGKYLLAEGLIDYYIRGEADIALPDLLSGIVGPGVNTDITQQIDDLDQTAYPNYSDVIDLPYLWTQNEPQIPITGSRGCVRQCTFCDIHTAWPKYRYRSGHSIAQEMIYQYEQHGVRNFWFTDSLINGNMKSFRQFCEALIGYYQEQKLPDRWFRWGGQFIVRDRRSMTSCDYDAAARAGLNGVAMGIESLSESVRDHMKKGFSDQDLDFTLNQMHRCDMNCYFLMIVGYPTETLHDHHQNISRFREYQHYALDGTIYGVNLGSTTSIDEGTPLHNMAQDLGLHGKAGADAIGYDWISSSNPDLDFRERIRRRIELQEILLDLGYKIWNADSQLLKLREAYEKIEHGKYKTKIRLQVAE